MSSNRHDVRQISFPGTPGTFLETFTTLNYLKYLLPYVSTLQIKDKPTDALITKTVLPEDLYLRSDIEDSDPLSSSYNKPRIDGYINKGMFTQLPITTVETTQTDPTIDYALPVITTLKTILPQLDNYPNFTSGDIFGGFKRGNKVYYTVAMYSEGNDFDVFSCDMVTGVVEGPWGCYNPNANGTTYYTTNCSNPVVDSNGDVFILISMDPSNGAMHTLYVLAKKTADPTANSGYYMETDPTISVAIDSTTVDFGFNFNKTSPMIIDEDNIKYILDENRGLYKIDEAGSTMVNLTTIGLDLTNSYSYYGVVYDTVSKTFWLSTTHGGLGSVVNLAKDGTVLATAPTDNTIDQGIIGNSVIDGIYFWDGFGHYRLRLSTVNLDGTFDYTDILQTAGTPLVNDSPSPYLDGSIITGDAGELVGFKGFVVPYDITEPLYAIDSLADSAYYERADVWTSQDTQNTPDTPIDFVQVQATPFGYTAAGANITYEMEYNGVWSTITDFLDTDTFDNIVYPYAKITKASLTNPFSAYLVIWNGASIDNTPETGILHATGIRITIVNVDKTVQYYMKKNTSTNTFYVDRLNTKIIA